MVFYTRTSPNKINKDRSNMKDRFSIYTPVIRPGADNRIIVSPVIRPPYRMGFIT